MRISLSSWLPMLSAVLGKGTLLETVKPAKHVYAGLSKNSPSHAQQKRNSIKRKNKQGK